MRSVHSNKILMRDYRINDKILMEILNQCVNYYLSLEELEKFIYLYYYKLEMRLNKRHQR